MSVKAILIVTCDHGCKGVDREEHVTGCRYRGTCCPTPTPVTTNSGTGNDRKTYNIVIIAVVLPCIFVLILACAIYLLRGTIKKAKLCVFRIIDKPNSSTGGRNEGPEYEEPRVYFVWDNRYDITC